MRFAFALAVAIIVAACALRQTSSEHAFVEGCSRASQATLDADAILRGMAWARQSSERVARDAGPNSGGPTPSAVTR